MERLSWVVYPLCIQWAVELASPPAVYARPILGFLHIVTVLVVVLWARTLAFAALHWGMRKAQPTQALTLGFEPLFKNIITLLAGAIGLIVILQHFGFDVLSLVTALGVSSLAVGLAAKDTLSHMIAGFALIIDRNLMPGDRVNIGGSLGEVEEIGLRSTRIRTAGGTNWIVPNSELVNTKIHNLGTAHSPTPVTSQTKISVASSFFQAKELLAEIIRSTPGVDHSSAPQVFLQSVTDGAQSIQISFRVGADQSADAVLSNVLEQWVKTAMRSQIQIAGAVQ
jgi:small-conductance mechanosensitive channel